MLLFFPLWRNGIFSELYEPGGSKLAFSPFHSEFTASPAAGDPELCAVRLPLNSGSSPEE